MPGRSRSRCGPGIGARGLANLCSRVHESPVALNELDAVCAQPIGSVREGPAPAMLDTIRTSLHHIISTPLGDRFAPVRVPKDLARRVNMLLGKPLCNAAELERRREARERLALLRSAAVASSSTTLPRAAAPVMIYFEKDRNVRLLGRIRETLTARNIAFTELDVSGDGPAKAYAMREAKCKEDDLPIVFVATTAVGGYNDLVEWDVSGKLDAAIYGAPKAAKP